MAEIYGIREKGAARPFYIGSTKYTSGERFKSHVSRVKAGNHRNRQFQDKAREIGIDQLECYLIEKVSGNPVYREYELINQYRRDGICLTNRSITAPRYALPPFNDLARNILSALSSPSQCEIPANQIEYARRRSMAQRLAVSLLCDHRDDLLRSAKESIGGTTVPC